MADTVTLPLNHANLENLIDAIGEALGVDHGKVSDYTFDVAMGAARGALQRAHTRTQGSSLQVIVFNPQTGAAQVKCSNCARVLKMTFEPALVPPRVLSPCPGCQD